MSLQNQISQIRNYINRFLLIAAILVVLLSSFGIQFVVRQIANDEQNKVKVWASSVQLKSQLITESKDFFMEIEAMERNRVQFLANSLSGFVTMDANKYEFFRRVMDENTTIPIVIVNSENKIFLSKNTDFDYSEITYFNDTLRKEFSQYAPIKDPEYEYYFYYKRSKSFSELEKMLDQLANSFIAEIVENSVSVPVLLVTEDERTVISAGNIASERYVNSTILRKTLEEMRQENTPIEISDGFENYRIFYEKSNILSRLTYIPIIFFIVIAIFFLLMVWTYRTTRRSENNKLWVGMSRETAHQLGTPLSSLIAWMEFLKINPVLDDESLTEIEKDIDRLKRITERFSKIGSEPKMSSENIVNVVYNAISYLQSRLSRKIEIMINTSPDVVILTQINRQLVEWVLENLTKNAADAIGTAGGIIRIDIIEQSKTVAIDVVDNGKGISKDKWKMIFDAGYTTKTRGWGLGLTLSQRIIHDYHNGKIFVKSSAIGEGTTFRIIFNK